MKQVLCVALLMSLGLLAGCNEEKKAAQEVKTVQWYTEHPEERTAQMKICANNPGQLKDDPNCINARQSMVRNSGGSVRRD